MDKPVISFLISHYNRPKSLLKCINAIRDLNLLINHEIIVSDDCSKTDIIKTIDNYNVDLIVKSEVNTGLSSNINRGIKQCSGNYIIYVQEDFFLKKELSIHLESLIRVLNTTSIEMIRLSSIVPFNASKPLDHLLIEIPRFSLKNFFIDQFRYSDNPYLVKKSFFEKYGLYKEGVNTSYGENEYMVRMMKLNPSIALCKKHLAYTFNLEGSIREENSSLKSKKRLIDKKIAKGIKRFLRSLRFKLEFILYNPTKRKLYTFKNLRRQS